VKISESFIGRDPFVMYLGDNLLNKGITQFVQSLIGKNVRISREPVKPSAFRFMLGDNSEVGIRW